MNANEKRLNDLIHALAFDVWFDELKQIHPWPNYVTNKYEWMDYYENGYTPKAAIEEDMSYAI